MVPARLPGLVAPEMGFLVQPWGAISFTVMAMLLIRSVSSLGGPLFHCASKTTDNGLCFHEAAFVPQTLVPWGSPPPSLHCLLSIVLIKYQSSCFSGKPRPALTDTA